MFGPNLANTSLSVDCPDKILQNYNIFPGSFRHDLRVTDEDLIFEIVL